MYERFALKRKGFHANSDFIWKHPDIFITQDEIDEFLRRGGAYEDGKFKIYSFFLLHKDKTVCSNFLKDRYGIGGCSHALCGADDSGADYNAKGLVLKRDVYKRQGSYYVDLFSDRLYNKTLQITSDNKDILIKNLFEFSEFASDEYLELSGNEEEIKKFYNIFGEYLR